VEPLCPRLGFDPVFSGKEREEKQGRVGGGRAPGGGVLGGGGGGGGLKTNAKAKMGGRRWVMLGNLDFNSSKMTGNAFVKSKLNFHS